RVGTGCPSRRHRREQRTRCASALQDRVTPLSSANPPWRLPRTRAAAAVRAVPWSCPAAAAPQSLLEQTLARNLTLPNAGSQLDAACSSALPKSPPAPSSGPSSRVRLPLSRVAIAPWMCLSATTGASR
ncbi:hypothetical protein Ctob_012967, partial [Chrysochromulina tobinii]